MIEHFKRTLNLGDLVLISMSDGVLRFGLVVSDKEVFGLLNNNYIVYKPYNVLLMDKNELVYHDLYEKLVCKYNEYTLKFKIKASKDLENIKVGDVFESNKKSGRYAVYLGHVTLEFQEERGQFKQQIECNHCYVVLPNDLLKNNGFMKSVFTGKMSLKLGNLLSYFVETSQSKFRNDGLLLQNKLSNEYVAKVGHINFILNSNSLTYSNHGFKKKFNLHNKFGFV